MPKIQQSKECLFLNLPVQYCRLMGWQKGIEIVVYPAKEENKALILKEVPK